MSVTERESRADIVTAYQRACEHADETIEALPVDAPGYMPWWPQPTVKLFNVMVHLVTETNRHLGHADILREQLDGALGSDPTPPSSQDDADWTTHRAKVERPLRPHTTSTNCVRTSAGVDQRRNGRLLAVVDGRHCKHSTEAATEGPARPRGPVSGM